MGDVVPIELILWNYCKLLEMYELEWQEHGYSVPMVPIHSVMFLLVTCFRGMRGYEAVWIDLDALRYDTAYCLTQKKGSG